LHGKPRKRLSTAGAYLVQAPEYSPTLDIGYSVLVIGYFFSIRMGRTTRMGAKGNVLMC
jgi:hypothetical protein